MTTRRSAVLLSVKPRFAEAILAGSKTVELRRRGIGTHPEAAVVLYATAPTMAVVGTARVGEVISLSPREAWRTYKHALGINRDEFNAYLAGAASAVLLRLTRPQTLDQPITLQELRSAVSAFHPPQSYRYVSPRDPEPLRQLVATPSDHWARSATTADSAQQVPLLAQNL